MGSWWCHEGHIYFTDPAPMLVKYAPSRLNLPPGFRHSQEGETQQVFAGRCKRDKGRNMQAYGNPLIVCLGLFTCETARIIIAWHCCGIWDKISPDGRQNACHFRSLRWNQKDTKTLTPERKESKSHRNSVKCWKKTYINMKGDKDVLAWGNEDIALEIKCILHGN